jgi:glycosyltransferase involved in cell wall biosynthesis
VPAKLHWDFKVIIAEGADDHVQEVLWESKEPCDCWREPRLLEAPACRSWGHLTDPVSRPLSVLHVHTRLIRGGADENTLLTVNGLDHSRFRVTLAVGGGSEASMLAQVAPAVSVVEVPELVREVAPLRDLAALRMLRRLIRVGRYDIVHTHTAKAGILGRFAAVGIAGPVIVHTLHGSTFHGTLSRAEYLLYWGLEKGAAAFTDRIITVGEDLRQRYLKAGIGRPQQYQLIRSGMELADFSAAAEMGPQGRAAVRRTFGVPPDSPLVGMVARLEPRKGYRYFLDLAETVLERIPQAHFVGFGAGDQHGDLQADIERRGLNGRVHLPGFRHDIAQVLAVLDVAVLTSLWEGLPRVLVQAAACGVPAVSFAVEGAHEVVKDGVNGWVVPLRDVRGMADHVVALLSDAELARAMGAAGRDLVSEMWTAENMVCQIAGAYLELIAARGHRGLARELPDETEANK